MNKFPFFPYIISFSMFLLLTTCGQGEEKRQDESWTNEEKTSFMENCRMNAENYPEVDADGYCQCVVEKMQERYSPKELSALPMGEITEEMGEFGRGCLNEQGVDISDIDRTPTDTATP